MKFFKFTIALLLLNNNFLAGQILPSPVFAQIPCFNGVGITDTVKVNPVVGATGYIWSTQNPANGITFNGQPGPIQTTLPQVGITTIVPLPFYEFGVKAVSACCTSATSSAILWQAKILFDQSNTSVAFPNSSSQYGVHAFCSQSTPMWEFFWNVTGDIGINGTGATSTSTPGSIPFIDLNFGPNFISGELCAWAINNFGIPTDTICMTINAPTSIDELHNTIFDVYYSNINSTIFIMSNENTGNEISYCIVDGKGSIIINGNHYFQKPGEQFSIPFRAYNSGIYFIRIATDTTIQAKKIAVVK